MIPNKYFYPRFTVIIHHLDYGNLYVRVPIQNILNRSRINGVYGFFYDLPGVIDVDLHLTGDSTQLPHMVSDDKFCLFNFTISGCGRCTLSLPSDVPESQFSSILKWIENFDDLTPSGVSMIVKGYVD